MSLGSFNNNENYQFSNGSNPTNRFSNPNQFKYPEVYSGYSLFNSSKDLPEEMHACITFSYWKSCIKISIAKRSASSFGKDTPSYDMENKLSIYVRHSKARMLANELKNLNPAELEEGKTVGIGSGSAVILIGCVNGVPAIIIRKAFEDGTKIEHVYIINQRYDLIIDHDSKSYRFQTDMEKYKYMEIDMLREQLESFANSMTNATAYSVVNTMAYDNYKTNNTINSIASKLGIDISGNKTNARFGYNSFNNTDSTSSFANSSIDELAESIGGI